MSEQENKDPRNSSNNEPVIEAEAVEVNQHESTNSAANKATSKLTNEVLTRILVTLLFGLIGWLSLWVFGVVVLVQFGFMLITGELNKNLKAFNGELVDYLSDILKYVGFQHEEKPFPFKGWHYDDNKNTDSSEPAK